LKKFAGFPFGRTHLTPIPAAFFSELLPAIDHLGELKVTLFALWFLDQQEGSARFVAYKDFAGDKQLIEGLGTDEEKPDLPLQDALDRTVQRGILLLGLRAGSPSEDAIFFLNSPRGRAALKAFNQGDWDPTHQGKVPAQLETERPNIFKLYEENIGPLTPLIAETLRDAEKEYPVEWVEEAVRAAVENNARSWRYVDAILRSRKEKPRDGTDRKDYKASLRRYLEGEPGGRED
jgi:DNA replication protein